MGVGVDQDLGPGRRVRNDRREGGHRAAREKQRGVLAEQFRDAGFETSRGGVAIEVVVTDVCRGDGGTHARSRAGDGVTAEVDRHGAEVSRRNCATGRPRQGSRGPVLA